jgi:hypothetical protein
MMLQGASSHHAVGSTTLLLVVFIAAMFGCVSCSLSLRDPWSNVDIVGSYYWSPPKWRWWSVDFSNSKKLENEPIAAQPARCYLYDFVRAMPLDFTNNKAVLLQKRCICHQRAKNKTKNRLVSWRTMTDP